MLNSIYTAAAKLSRGTSGNKEAELETQPSSAEAASDTSESLDRFPPRPSASSDRRGQSVDVRRTLSTPSGSGSLKVPRAGATCAAVSQPCLLQASMTQDNQATAPNNDCHVEPGVAWEPFGQHFVQHRHWHRCQKSA